MFDEARYVHRFPAITLETMGEDLNRWLYKCAMDDALELAYATAMRRERMLERIVHSVAWGVIILMISAII